MKVFQLLHFTTSLRMRASGKKTLDLNGVEILMERPRDVAAAIVAEQYDLVLDRNFRHPIPKIFLRSKLG